MQHRFFTRQGGVSEGLYSSLNCGYGSGDLLDNVRENRRRAAAHFALGETDLPTVHQIHSTDVLAVGVERWTSPGAPRADALVTDRPGVALGVMAADCAPVPFADPRPSDRRRARRLESGRWAVSSTPPSPPWKARRRRERVRAAIGPCIGAASYEVGPEFPAPFLAQDQANATFFRPAKRAGHFMFDLAGYLLQRLALAGVTASATGHDTLAATDDFFSYRRNHAARRARLRPRPVGRGAPGMTCPT